MVVRSKICDIGDDILNDKEIIIGYMSVKFDILIDFIRVDMIVSWW